MPRLEDYTGWLCTPHSFAASCVRAYLKNIQEVIMAEISLEKIEQFKRGELNLGQLLDIDIDQVAALILTGQNMIQQGRIEDAKTIFEGLAAFDGKNPYVFGVLGSIYQKEENFDLALAHYSKTLELFPNDIYSRANRGEI